MDITVQHFAVANLRRRPVVVETGGFVAGFDPDTDSPSVNYATPLPGAVLTAAGVAALVAAFRERGLLPRLEFAPGAVPAAEPALRAAGFTTEAEHEFLVCDPGTLHPPGAGAPVAERPRTDEDLAALDAVLSEAFGGPYASSPAGTARLRRLRDTGGAVRLARAADGTVAGGACCSAPAVGTAELAGVGTRPAHRRRGVAAAVTAALAADLFAAGAGTVWLEYSGEGSRRVYERVGFRPSGRRLYLALEG